MIRGKRVRHFFRKREEAETKALQLRTSRKNEGFATFSLSEQDRVLALECIAFFYAFGKTLRDAVEYYVPQLEAEQNSVTFERLLHELLAAKTADKVSGRYLRDMRDRLGRFRERFGDRLVASINPGEIANWLRSLKLPSGEGVSMVTRNNARRLLTVAFSFAQEQGYCVGNPAKKTKKAKEPETEVGILRPDQLKNLLGASPPALVPFLALGAFAGLRRAELERLDWAEVKLQTGFVEVKASKAKSARRRLIRIRNNLREWLKPFREAEGKVTPSNYRELLDAAREKAALKRWPTNALRHSFASYALAHESNAPALALELGHKDTDMIFKHYRELVAPDEAAFYWQILPKSKKRVSKPKAAHSTALHS